MLDDLTSSLEIIQSHAVAINQATDQANEVVRLVEGLLEQSRIGISEEVDSEYQDGEGSEVSLAYARINGKYRIVVGYRRGGQDPREAFVTVTAWSECTREEKLVTVRVLPDLLKKISSRLLMQLQYAHNATLSTTGVLTALKSYPQPSPETDEGDPNVYLDMPSGASDDAQELKEPPLPPTPGPHSSGVMPPLAPSIPRPSSTRPPLVSARLPYRPKTAPPHA